MTKANQSAAAPAEQRQKRGEWAKPAVRRISAGSAENASGSVADLGNFS